ncbi:nitric oxide reductase activation protein NorD [Ectothiorhodospira lacustris]|uniref:nitric oxide reductase activation protein NorD n=1 Tax=Ectothiorhodospira lacustris TaxID=2899127 RepID=UPI001EE94589|nr:VWA domain-containing protein [Ectothiorhodospira lacustris]MCG5501936.1 VWA domain-containing protein [Ectothiorhodospira lacustris]MCG5510679.1 VWA domain-containing protein [Ectothiorhodospira lacustris]MCG5522421.1 VWA domain-containing protein [Ectothiorhodospira lacustris]
MSVHLEDYPELLEDLGGHAVEVLESAWQEAVRSFSSAGLKNYYMEGARALHALGKGTEPVAAFVQESPVVARELGEDAVMDLIEAVIKLSSKTSGAVISLVIATSPVASRRLADPTLFKGYLRLLDNLVAQVPRGVRPMLEHLDPLLTHLTLGGLRRWALWGAKVHGRDFKAQTAYFGLETPESRSVFQNERRGTLFVDVQRRINMYLRALWARDFFLRPTSGDFESREGVRPFIDGFTLYVPDAYDDAFGISGLQIYRATAAHAAAHLVHSRTRMPADNPGGLTGMLVGLFEDARVETLALAVFPGLRQLWVPMHVSGPDDGDGTTALLGRAARALLDPDYADPHPFVQLARVQFDAAATDLTRHGLAWDLAHRLAPAFPTDEPFSSRHHHIPVLYRDDNRYIWALGEQEDVDLIRLREQPQVRRNVTLMEMVNGLDVPFAGDDAQEIWTLSTEFFCDEEETSLNEQEGKPPVSPPFHYPEWDYQMQLERPHWCTLLERRPRAGDPAEIDAVAQRHKPLISRMKYLIEAMQPQGVQRYRRQPDGDELDLNAAVESLVDLRMGRQPDTRVHIRTERKVRDLSVLVLIDLSESTNDKVRGTDNTVLDLAREATALLAGALSKIGDPFAIHGFDSDGRHDVEYYRFKDFDAPYDDTVKARLAGMTGQMSTRMGTAIRHAGEHLRRQPSRRKLLLIVTDGEPADTDVRDPQYLRQDAKHAVEEVAKHGVYSFCMSLDPHADDYVERIFGARRYMVVDHVARLPETLPMLYAGLTR